MKSIVYIVFILLTWQFLWWSSVFASENICWRQSGEALYECRVEQICETYKSEKPVYNTIDFDPISSDISIDDDIPRTSLSLPLDKAKFIYRENMANIYKCWVIQSQRNTLNFIKRQIRLEISGQLTDVIGTQIDTRLEHLQASASDIWCSLTDPEVVYNKLNILRETTYEACKYINYLEWIREYHQNPNNILPPDDTRDRISNPELSIILNAIEDDINAEISHTFQVFPIAYQAYVEYENHFPLHFMLTVIRWDYIVLRNRIYQVFMPIAQLGYKVINAMSY